MFCTLLVASLHHIHIRANEYHQYSEKTEHGLESTKYKKVFVNLDKFNEWYILRQ